MKTIRTRKGLTVPLKGAPDQIVYPAADVTQVGISALDYPGLKPRLRVKEGDRVKRGEPLLTDKVHPAIHFVSPAGGRVVSIHRGARRVLEGIAVEVDGDDVVEFKVPGNGKPDPDAIRSALLSSGLWPVIRMRPFEMVADPDVPPQALFVTAMDTQPHAPRISAMLAGREEDFRSGMRLLSRLAGVPVFLCRDPGTELPLTDLSGDVREVVFQGPHPAGNVGTHIHFLSPVCRGRRVWHVGFQDVLAIGEFFRSGCLPVERILSLAGPAVRQPRLLRTRLGASLPELTRGEVISGDIRLISGSVLTGFTVTSGRRFLGRYHQQVSALREGGRRRFLGWLYPGFSLFSAKGVVASHFMPRRDLDLNTDIHGGRRAIIPTGVLESVCPLDILSTPLMRALMVDDLEDAEKLGVLELAEEDVALFSFVSASKLDYAEALRRNLETIRKEG
ncbi:MAG TPA: Na(+)-translocating NADH-quinone reductase subunit A [Candidatus Aminicenantes bacterium]|nr:Na(+)-translocating NADH-quinone reductase subunit A [Candidatus Aminicenantes bacterium]